MLDVGAHRLVALDANGLKIHDGQIVKKVDGLAVGVYAHDIAHDLHRVPGQEDGGDMLLLDDSDIAGAFGFSGAYRHGIAGMTSSDNPTEIIKDAMLRIDPGRIVLKEKTTTLFATFAINFPLLMTERKANAPEMIEKTGLVHLFAETNASANIIEKFLVVVTMHPSGLVTKNLMTSLANMMGDIDEVGQINVDSAKSMMMQSYEGSKTDTGTLKLGKAALEARVKAGFLSSNKSPGISAEALVNSISSALAAFGPTAQYADRFRYVSAYGTAVRKV